MNFPRSSRSLVDRGLPDYLILGRGRNPARRHRKPRRMLIRLMLLTLFVLSGFACAEEPLPPEQAFRFSARAVDAKTIEARWQITDQYYMYRDKFKFAAEGGTLGAPKYPPGKMKEDENFGKVEVPTARK
jgi:hypothetical protein